MKLRGWERNTQQNAPRSNRMQQSKADPFSNRDLSGYRIYELASCLFL